MKAIQYVTSENQECEVYPVFPTLWRSGALTLTREEDAVSDDFRGFGVAITGSSCYLLSTMEETARRALIGRIYGKNGLGLSVARLSIGASDYSAETYSYDDIPNDVALEHFSIDRDRAYVIPMIKEILAVNLDLYLFASPWSPPGWMKTNGRMCGGYMRDKYVACYADYIIKFLEAYEECGIHVSAITPQNEPETQQHGQMPACIWHPDIEARFVSVLRRKLDEKGMDTEIWMYDYNFDNVERVKASLDDHEALRRDASGIAFHYYRGDIAQCAEVQEAYPELKMHFTEGGPRLYDNYATDWCKWGIMMSEVLHHGFGSFTGWNLLLNENGGPNVGPFFCGGLVTLNSRSGELSYSGQYKAFRHIVPFMKKGSRVHRVAIDRNGFGMFGFGINKARHAMHAVSFETPDGKIVYILSNPDKEKRQVQFFERGEWWYSELLPNSLSTVVVE